MLLVLQFGSLVLSSSESEERITMGARFRFFEEEEEEEEEVV